MGLFKNSKQHEKQEIETCKFCKKIFPLNEINPKSKMCNECTDTLISDREQMSQLIDHYFKKIEIYKEKKHEDDIVNFVAFCSYILEACYIYKFKYADKGIDEIAGIQDNEEMIAHMLNLISLIRTEDL